MGPDCQSLVCAPWGGGEEEVKEDLRAGMGRAFEGLKEAEAEGSLTA